MSPSNAHPGGLAADGCHNDRKNGGRHCHRGSNAGGSSQPQRASDGRVYYAQLHGRPECWRSIGSARRAWLWGHLDRDNDGVGCEQPRLDSDIDRFGLFA
nr:YHYH domain-containing protein [Tsuneonella troitsensis]